MSRQCVPCHMGATSRKTSNAFLEGLRAALVSWGLFSLMCGFLGQELMT